MNLLGLFIGFFLLPFTQLQTLALSVRTANIRQVSTVENLHFSVDAKQLDAFSNFQLEFKLSNEQRRIRLNLQPSRNIVSPLTEVRYLGSGETSGSLEKPLESSTLLFKGDAIVSDDGGRTWRKAGWARIIIRPQIQPHLFEGAFSLDGDHHHVSLDSNYRKTRLAEDPTLPESTAPYMVVWRESNMVQNNYDGGISQRSASTESPCAAEVFGSRPQDNSAQRNSPGNEDDQWTNYTITSHRRQQGGFNPIDTIGSTDGCPTTRLVALLGVAADCTYTAGFDSLEDARANIISQVNIASQIYEDTFNISLAIRNLTISDASCPTGSTESTPWNIPCSANVDVSGRLGLFSNWRGTVRDSNAAWTLLTTCSAGSTVGMAWINSICRRGSRWGGTAASTNVVVRTSSEWQVMAHELAHNFGAAHDCTSNDCSSSGGAQDCCPLSESSCSAEGRYIMNPSVGQRIREFSPCTIGTICTSFGRGLIDTSCLVSEDDAPDINDSQCGNGIVEPGESCDCGSAEECATNSCCNPSTCQLLPNAACDPAIDACCTEQCQIASRGLVCRESSGICDPEETCDGTSSQCPVDEQDSDSCGDDGGNSRDNESGDNNGGGSVGSWFDDNRTVVIAVSASVGGLILIAIFFTAMFYFRQRRRKIET
ncbi:hypothetical protein AUP68_12053 [Ilyonectria robusta]